MVELDTEIMRKHALTSLSASLIFMRPTDMTKERRTALVECRDPFLTDIDKKILFTVFGLAPSKSVPEDFQIATWSFCKQVFFSNPEKINISSERSLEDLKILLFFKNISNNREGNLMGLYGYIKKTFEQMPV